MKKILALLTAVMILSGAAALAEETAALSGRADQDTVLYYHPDGGQYYHVDENCQTVNPRFQPLQGMFFYRELNYEEYRDLQPCNVCGAPGRDQAPENPAGFLLKVYDRSGLANVSYLRIDYYAGEEQLGFLCSCPDNGEDFYRFPIEVSRPEDLKAMKLELSYGSSDLPPEEAILQVLSGVPAEKHPLLTLDWAAESGKTYSMNLVPGSWLLEPVEPEPAFPAEDLSVLSDQELIALYLSVQEEMEQRRIAGGNREDVTYMPSDEADETPEERLTRFFLYWSENDLDHMLELCAPGWKDHYETPKTGLFIVLANRTPVSYEISLINGEPEDEVRTASVITAIDRHNGKDPQQYLLNIVMRKEDGVWYVDPDCLKTYEPAETLPAAGEPTAEPED